MKKLELNESKKIVGGATLTLELIRGPADPSVEVNPPALLNMLSAFAFVDGNAPGSDKNNIDGVSIS